jgi:hypothetical protein
MEGSFETVRCVEFEIEKGKALTHLRYGLDLDVGSDGIVQDDRHDFNDDILRRKENSIVDSALPLDQSTLENYSTKTDNHLIHRADSCDSLDNICPGERRGSSSSHQQRARDNSRSTRRSSIGSVDSDGGREENLLDPDHKLRLGIGITVAKPPVHVFDEEEEELSGESERKWMREFYEKEGWLPGPRPSKATLENRKRTV